MAATSNKPGLKKVIGQGDLKKMDPMQRARHMAYEQPSKSIAASLLMTQNRLKEHALRSIPDLQKQVLDHEEERQKKVVGQLKAAEARNRIRLMRIRYQWMKAQEVKYLVSSQPTARDAIRLEVLLPPGPPVDKSRDPLHWLQRDRVERLLEDDEGLMTLRIP
ncbi:protein LKAAEAR1 [Eleutherodactylus coqui]|uniref:protein LKAAEAR1 n=1 Tax=Eleutherodactylus coqui TaxID=57060 RepID=UPI003461A30B